MTDIRNNRSAAPPRYAKALDQCRDIALIFCDAQITELFENAGAALLDFAERAENNTIQGRFFEAMNVIQRKRPDIEHSFRRGLAHGFAHFGDAAPPAVDDGPRTRGDEDLGLELVPPDEMEEDVASNNLIIKANANYFPELFALSQRLAAINGGGKLKDYEIPAGPHHLVHSFRSAIGDLEVEVKIKIILYALFDKFVIKQAKSIYDEFNSSLKAAGILPNLKPVHTAQPSRDGPAYRPHQPNPGRPQNPHRRAQGAGTEYGAGYGRDSIGNELFDSIIDLMATHPNVGGYGSARRGSGPGKPVPPAVAEATSGQLVTALGSVQSQKTTHDILPTTSGIPSIEIDREFLENVKRTLSEEREHALAQIDRENLSPMDADLIDLIGMLFEYMLNDPILPNLAKALLSHLHTPYLKVAIIDRTLLVDAGHPARRLLDLLVESGSLWMDETNPQRGIFPAIQRVVDRVLQEFTDDVSLFEELLKSFEADMREQQRRSDTMEQRTQEAARGREKLQLAKRRATHHIQTLLQGHPLPQPVTAFLSKTWLDQLVFILLRDKQEERGEAWRHAVETSDELTELFAPNIEAAEQQARKAGIPRLKKDISEAVQRMGSYSHSTLDALFGLLENPQTWAAGRPLTSTLDRAEADATARELADAARPLAEATEHPAEQISEQEQEVIKRLRKMKFGTWFEFASSIGGTPRRIKLSWLSPLTSTCMFVDRSGMQAEIKTLRELAQEILSGRAKVIPRPKHPFIERALVSIRKMLQGEEDGARTETAGS